MQVLIAIAALCSVPTFRHLTEDKVLQCQKYYIKCIEKQTTMSLALSEHLAKCVLEKKKLGGGE